MQLGSTGSCKLPAAGAVPKFKIHAMSCARRAIFSVAPACKFLWIFRTCFNRMTILLFQLLRKKNLPKTSIFQETAFNRLSQWCASPPSVSRTFFPFNRNNLRLRKKDTGMKNIHAGVHIDFSAIIASVMSNAVYSTRPQAHAFLFRC